MGISAVSASLDEIEALEDVAEHAIELVEIALVLHQRRARQIIEILDTARGDILLHRLHQREVFAQRHRHAGGLKLVEEGREHSSHLVFYITIFLFFHYYNINNFIILNHITKNNTFNFFNPIYYTQNRSQQNELKTTLYNHLINHMKLLSNLPEALIDLRNLVILHRIDHTPFIFSGGDQRPTKIYCIPQRDIISIPLYGVISWITSPRSSRRCVWQGATTPNCASRSPYNVRFCRRTSVRNRSSIAHTIACNIAHAKLRRSFFWRHPLSNFSASLERPLHVSAQLSNNHLLAHSSLISKPSTVYSANVLRGDKQAIAAQIQMPASVRSAVPARCARVSSSRNTLPAMPTMPCRCVALAAGTGANARAAAVSAQHVALGRLAILEMRGDAARPEVLIALNVLPKCTISSKP